MSRLKTTKQERDGYESSSIRCGYGNTFFDRLNQDANLAAELEFDLSNADAAINNLAHKLGATEAKSDFESMNVMRLQEKLAAAEQANAKLREALRFYAEGEWNDDYPGGIKYGNETTEGKLHLLDTGETARAALRGDAAPDATDTTEKGK